MPYIGQRPTKGDENNFKILDDISSYTLTFDGSDSSVVSAANDTITSLNHRFITGQRVRYTNGGGSNIAGLSPSTVYFIIKEDHNTIKLATSASNANNGTAVPINGLGVGSSHTLNVAFDGVNTKFKATHTNGVKAKITRSAQLVISINGVIQQPHDSTSPSTGFGFDLDGVIILSQAPASTDIFWAHVLTNNNVTFDISDNTVDNFTGDGSTTEFNLSKVPPNNENVLVTIDGVLQYPDSASVARAYTVAANVLKFSSAPANKTEIQVRHIGFAGASTAAVTGFYGRSGNATLKSTDNILVGNIASSGNVSANDLTLSGDLTVNGDFTTLNTTLREVELLRVSAGSTLPAGIITQTNTGDILSLYDNTTEVFKVADGGDVTLGGGKIYGNTNASNTFTLQSTSGNSNHSRIEIGAIQSSDNGGIHFYTAGSSVATRHMTLKGTSGNLGIGINDPSSKLEGYDGDIYLNSTDKKIFLTSDYDQYITANAASNYLVLGAANKERFRIASDGDVSIGSTADALRRLDVVGNSILVRPTTETGLHSSGNASAVNNSIIVRMPYGENAAATSNAGARFGIQFTGANNTTDQATLNFENDPWKSASIYGVSEDVLGYNRTVGIAFYTSAFDSAQTEKLRITGIGSVGIGTAIPESLLHLKGTGGNTSGLTFGNGNNRTFKMFFGNNSNNSQFNMNYGGTGQNELIFTQSANIIANQILGNLGIGTYNPSAKLHVRGTNATDHIFRVDKHQATNDSLPKVLVRDDGHIGIGTTNPGYILEFGNVLANNNVKIGNRMTNQDYGIAYGYYDNLSGNHGFGVDVNHGGTVKTNVFVVKANDGHVGIGTDVPAEEFHLYGNSAIVALIESIGDNDSRVRIKAPPTKISYLEFADDDADAGEIRYDHSDDHMAFHVYNNKERLRIDSGGNVQIGSATTTANLRYVDIQNIATGNGAGSILRLITTKSDGSDTTSADIVKYKTGGLVINNNEVLGTTGFISFGTGSSGGSVVERVRITSTGQTLLTRGSQGGREHTGNNSNFFKIGTWYGIDQTSRLKITIFGTSTFDSDADVAGETIIYISSNANYTLKGHFHSHSNNRAGVQKVAFKYNSGTTPTSCEVWIKYNGSYSCTQHKVDASEGYWEGADVDTGSTSVPSGATEASPFFAVATSDGSQSYERLRINSGGEAAFTNGISFGGHNGFSNDEALRMHMYSDSTTIDDSVRFKVTLTFANANSGPFMIEIFQAMALYRGTPSYAKIIGAFGSHDGQYGGVSHNVVTTSGNIGTLDITHNSTQSSRQANSDYEFRIEGSSCSSAVSTSTKCMTYVIVHSRTVPAGCLFENNV